MGSDQFFFDNSRQSGLGRTPYGPDHGRWYPVTILEMGFMTSQNDDLKMNDAEFQKTMVQGIANGIDSYFAS